MGSPDVLLRIYPITLESGVPFLSYFYHTLFSSELNTMRVRLYPAICPSYPAHKPNARELLSRLERTGVYQTILTRAELNRHATQLSYASRSSFAAKMKQS